MDNAEFQKLAGALQSVFFDHKVAEALEQAMTVADPVSFMVAWCIGYQNGYGAFERDSR